MKDRVANMLLVLGAVVLSLGAGLVYMPAGPIVAGIMCICGGYVLAASGDKQ